MAGYGIGYWGFEQLGRPILEMYGKTDQFDEFRQTYNEWGAWAVLVAGITPFPFKVITITSGMTQLNPVVFVVASIVARAARFYLVAGLLWKFGPPIREFIEKRLGLVTIIFFVGLIGGFVVLKYFV